VHNNSNSNNNNNNNNNTMRLSSVYPSMSGKNQLRDDNGNRYHGMWIKDGLSWWMVGCLRGRKRERRKTCFSVERAVYVHYLKDIRQRAVCGCGGTASSSGSSSSRMMLMIIHRVRKKEATLFSTTTLALLGRCLKIIFVPLKQE